MIDGNSANHFRALVAHSKRKYRRNEMTLCPIAIVAGCKKCPVFTVCPLKSVIGDYRKEEETQTKQQTDMAKRDEKRAK